MIGKATKPNCIFIQISFQRVSNNFWKNIKKLNSSNCPQTSAIDMFQVQLILPTIETHYYDILNSNVVNQELISEVNQLETVQYDINMYMKRFNNIYLMIYLDVSQIKVKFNCGKSARADGQNPEYSKYDPGTLSVMLSLLCIALFMGTYHLV